MTETRFFLRLPEWLLQDEKWFHVLSKETVEQIAVAESPEKTEMDCSGCEDAFALAEKLKTMIFNFQVKSGKDGRVFGSVSTKQIVEELARHDIKVDKKKFLDTAPIVSLGVTKVRVELYKGVIATVSCNLKGSE